MQEDPPRKATNIVIGEDIAALSSAELEQRIIALEAEINRYRLEISKKRRSLAAASAYFKV